MHALRNDILTDRLIAAQRPSGAWAYSARGAGAAEPTALGTLALLSRPDMEARPAATRGAEWLASIQKSGGEVPVSAELAGPCWPTSLAVLAWLRADAGRFRDSVTRAVRWMLACTAKTSSVRTAEHQHDASLVGWAWVDGTHSWVEPTAYAMLALRAAGHAAQPRFDEAQRLIVDRAIPSGGWNYGNTQVLANTLRPFPETTGVALAALAGGPRLAAVERGIEFLGAELPRIRSPLALGWGLIGLAAWDARPAAAAEWLSEAIDRLAERPANPQHDALLLIAASPPWIGRWGEAA
ncbi:MAG: hypothetical protein AMXMBFR47_40430 [Planctomycetota bacterium]